MESFDFICFSVGKLVFYPYFWYIKISKLEVWEILRNNEKGGSEWKKGIR